MNVMGSGTCGPANQSRMSSGLAPAVTEGSHRLTGIRSGPNPRPAGRAARPPPRPCGDRRTAATGGLARVVVADGAVEHGPLFEQVTGVAGAGLIFGGVRLVPVIPAVPDGHDAVIVAAGVVPPGLVSELTGLVVVHGCLPQLPGGGARLDPSDDDERLRVQLRPD